MRDKNTHSVATFRPASALVLGTWILAFLILVDVAINLLFAYPQDKRVIPTSLQSYFDYGRSTEAKLMRLIGASPAEDAGIAQFGWLKDLSQNEKNSISTENSQRHISVYGSSFAERLGNAAQALEPDTSVHIVRAPAATLNWSHAAFKRDTEQHTPDAAVLTILSQGLGKLSAMTGATANFDLPFPYTQPHYSLPSAAGKSELAAEQPVIQSLSEMRYALYSRGKLWNDYVEQLRRYDPYFQKWLFSANWIDRSALLRLARRGYWAWHKRRVEQGLYSAEGFNPDHPVTKMTRVLVRRFVAETRAHGIFPVIYLVNNYGMQAHLYELLASTLDELGVAYVSSHTEISASDPRAYLPDSHFRPDLDKLMAQQVLMQIP